MSFLGFGKDGIFTKAIESLPGGGHITAGFHKNAGNDQHAKNAIQKSNKQLAEVTKAVKALPGGDKLTQASNFLYDKSGFLVGKDGVLTQTIEGMGGGVITSGFHQNAGNNDHSNQALTKFNNQWNDPLSKDGILTQAIELAPGGGFVTAPFHAAAGNYTEASCAIASGVMNKFGGTVIKQGMVGMVQKTAVKQVIKETGKLAGQVSGIGYDSKVVHQNARCPQDHILRLYSERKFQCDLCRENYNGKSWYCQTCNYDECLACNEGRSEDDEEFEDNCDQQEQKTNYISIQNDCQETWDVSLLIKGHNGEVVKILLSPGKIISWELGIVNRRASIRVWKKDRSFCQWACDFQIGGWGGNDLCVLNSEVGPIFNGTKRSSSWDASEKFLKG